MKILKFTAENLSCGLVTDNANPRFSFSFESEKSDARLDRAVLSVGEWTVETLDQLNIPYSGRPLKPLTKYRAHVVAYDNFGDAAEAELTFRTGRMNLPWAGYWITDGGYRFRQKRVSPVPMTFRKVFRPEKPVACAAVYATAMGIYELKVNGIKAGDRYFAPGFTSYKHVLQYQRYEVTDLLTDKNEIIFTVAGGWAVGSFVFTRKNRISADRQALLAEIRIEYKDGTTQVIGTDDSWDVALGGNYLAADFYDGETYDATAEASSFGWHKASREKLRTIPRRILAEYGSPVKAHEVMRPVCLGRVGDEIIYDFGQNFAGVICADIRGEKGRKVVFRHSEILNGDGSPATQLLRSAKATATYICRDGQQQYSPVFTYMGFRYVGVSGIDEKDIDLKARALYSDLEIIGSFECSDERINKLQSNIIWSSKSNFMDIPTDCPQRDERMGWTGDIGIFSPTACFNFDMTRFFEKWLFDLRSEQLKTGGIPNTIPVQGYGFPATMPVMAVDFWGDACLLVPWAQYMSRGDKTVLRDNYASMKKYVDACTFWASFGFGKNRYIWHTPHSLHFGDWVAPGVPTMAEWQKRSKWTATASLAHTSGLLSTIASILGKTDDARKYSDLSKKVAEAYMAVFTDGNAKLKNQFQTAYVLPLAFGMFPENQRERAAENLAVLVRENDYCVGTGFPGTPYVLFALADNGCKDEAFAMLTNDKCPSWLYQVRAGGTTIWERWDALKEDGTLNSGESDGTNGMVSFNHYASGAVGQFLYTRVAGIVPLDGGYKKFRVAPVVGGGLTYARASTICPYGKISSSWKSDGGKFSLEVEVPASTRCTVVLPNGYSKVVGSGSHSFECVL